MNEKKEVSEYRSAAHSLCIEGRRIAHISGVIDVEAFCEEEATILTQEGALTIWGKNMKLGKLDPEAGLLSLEGEIQSLEYEQPQKRRFGLFSK